MANFIKSLAVSMNASGLTPRATVLFTQAKSIGYFRWGSRARTVAGACLSLALRESKRPDSIHDISILLRCSPQLLSRTFISLASALKITTLSVDPSVYVATVQSHLSTILQEQQGASEISSPLLKALRSLSLVAVSNTARSLGRTLARTFPSESANKSSAASTACALFMLSLEAENRDTLASIGDLAKCIATRCHIGKGVVMSQYKAIQDQVAQLVEKVPWLEGYSQKGGRAKVSKRLVVARGLKDVIRFNEEIMQNTLLPDAEFELSSEDGDFDWEEDHDGDTGDDRVVPNNVQLDQGSPSPSNADNQISADDRPPPKRRKIHHSLDEASRFLLNPFATLSSPSPSTSKRVPAASQPKPSISKFPLTSYVLSTSSLSSVGQRPPTRLQLLTAARGGSDEDAIRDEELFAEGELQGLLRKDDEIAVMRRILDWEDNTDDEDVTPKSTKKRKLEERSAKGKQASGATAPPAKKSRVNMEAFAKFMQGEECADGDDDTVDGGHGDGQDQFEYSLLGLDNALGFAEDDGGEEAIVEEQDDHPISTTLHAHQRSLCQDSGSGEEMVLELDEWRPASPAGGGDCFENRYEEEYD